MSTILTIQFPEDFDSRYTVYKTGLLGKSELMEEEPTSRQDREDIAQTSKTLPSTIIEDKRGYLILNGEKVHIGGASTGKFRLVECLCAPFGTAKTIDVVFASINSKRGGNNDVSADEYLARNNKKTVIENQFGEIQRAISAHRRRLIGKKTKNDFSLSLKMDDMKCWLER